MTVRPGGTGRPPRGGCVLRGDGKDVMPVRAHPTSPTDSLSHPTTEVANDLASAGDPDPLSYGVGARFSLFPMRSDFVEVILGALASASGTGLVIETTDVSTFVGGPEAAVLEYLRHVIARAADAGGHLAAQIMLSRGCPGELVCAPPLGADGLPRPWAPEHFAALETTGHRTSAHWSLYPLLDPATGRPAVSIAKGLDTGEITAHMDPIVDAIDVSKSEGTYAGSEHFATRLEGDLADVLTTVARAWVAVGRSVQHVTTHLTLSINSPSAAPRRISVEEQSR